MDKTQSTTSASPQNPLQPASEFMQGGDADAICQKYGITRTELEQLVSYYQHSRSQMALADHVPAAKTGRNQPCPCGSGKKYKKCCLTKHEEVRKSMPADQWQEMEERQKQRERHEKDVQRGFDFLFAEDFSRAQNLASRLLESYPEDDRLHDIVLMALMASGDYDGAIHICRRRWQVAQEEKEFFQENHYHKREGVERKQLVHFYSPSTWLEKLWIAQRARTYREDYPAENDSEMVGLVDKLKIANDVKRFPDRQEEGYEIRKQALAPVLRQLESTGSRAIPYLLPLTYNLSWASLFVPDILAAYGTEESVHLLAELSMFRFPFFAQNCLANLEKFDQLAVAEIAKVLQENPAFDELKVGLIAVLGSIKTPASFDLLIKMTEHDNPYVISWSAEALSRHQNPEALPYLENAKGRLKASSKIAGAIQNLVGAEKS